MLLGIAACALAGRNRTRLELTGRLAGVGAAAVLLASACTGGDGEEAGTTTITRPATTSTGAAPTEIPAPADFTAEAAAFAVVLSWTPPAGEVEAERFTIYRDGALLSGVQASDSSFTDHDVVPGRRYSYEIVAAAGDLVSDSVTVDARTRVPPLRTARVAGVFNVRAKPLSQSGYSRFGGGTFGWRFRPRCESGPCDVRWNDLTMRRVRAPLDRQRARYRGSYTGPFTVECSGNRVTSSVTIAFQVDAARPLAGEWRATRIRGTLDHSEAAQLGCVSSQARLSIRGRLLR
jgi:hypothetical protein